MSWIKQSIGSNNWRIIQAFQKIFSIWFFYMILCWIYVCYKFLTMKAKSFVVRKIVGKIFLWRHQFILFSFCFSPCMLHQVLVILEAGKQLCIFWVPIWFGFMNVDPETNTFVMRYYLFVAVVCLFVFLTKKPAGCFLIQNNNYLFVSYFFFS